MLDAKENLIWDGVAKEIRRLRKNDAWLARRLGVSRTTVSGWKSRGVPASRHDDIAELFGWTMERLVSGQNATPAAPAKPAETVSAPESPHFVGTRVPEMSPIATSLGIMLDEIADEAQRMRCYAMAIQLFTLSGMPAMPAPVHKPAEKAQMPLPLSAKQQPLLWPTERRQSAPKRAESQAH